jgi:hypothetical protein
MGLFRPLQYNRQPIVMKLIPMAQEARCTNILRSLCMLSPAQRESLMARRSQIERQLAELSMTDSSIRRLTGAEAYAGELIDERDEIQQRLRVDHDARRKQVDYYTGGVRRPHTAKKSRRLVRS